MSIEDQYENLSSFQSKSPIRTVLMPLESCLIFISFSCFFFHCVLKIHFIFTSLVLKISLFYCWISTFLDNWKVFFSAYLRRHWMGKKLNEMGLCTFNFHIQSNSPISAWIINDNYFDIHVDFVDDDQTRRTSEKECK